MMAAILFQPCIPPAPNSFLISSAVWKRPPQALFACTALREVGSCASQCWPSMNLIPSTCSITATVQDRVQLMLLSARPIFCWQDGRSLSLAMAGVDVALLHVRTAWVQTL